MTRASLRVTRTPLCFGAAMLIALAVSFQPARGQDPTLRYGGQIPPEVDTVYQRGLTWLANAQGTDGTWKGGNEGCGVDGICLMAFLASGEDPNYGRYAPTIRRALRSIITHQEEKTGYLPSSMYHHGFGMPGSVRGIRFGGRIALVGRRETRAHHWQDSRSGDPLHGGFAKEKSLGWLAVFARCHGRGHVGHGRGPHGSAGRAQCRLRRA